MPYVDIPDHVSLWYTTNCFTANVGGFDPVKPSIMMLHPNFMDSSWLSNQFHDPRLDDHYNLIAFDLRACGKSKCPSSDLHDSWVDAADLAFAHQALQLPACHVFAVETLSVNCALRFAILFPELCLSLTLCNVPPPTDTSRVFNSYEELLRSWSYAEDLESFELAGTDASSIILEKDHDTDLLDDLMDFWAEHMRPAVRLRTVEMFNVIMNRSPLKGEEMLNITQPVLIIQGERCPICPVKHAEELATELRRARGGARLYTLKGLSGSPTIIPNSASIVNRTFIKFLCQLPAARSTLVAPTTPIVGRMKEALSKLASLAGDPTIGTRNPTSPSSFSRVTPEVQKSQADSLQAYKKGLSAAFSPLDHNGKPHRRYTDRRKQHWFHSDRNGMSYIGDSDLATAYQKNRLAGLLEKPNDQTPTTPQRTSVESLSKKTKTVDMNNPVSVVDLIV